MDQVAAELSCSKRSLYALASSKEQLAAARRAALLQASHRAGGGGHRPDSDPGDTGHPLPRGGGRGAAARPSRAFRDDVARFRPAAEIYEQNTISAASRVRELIDEGTRAGAFRQVPAAFVSEVVTATMRRITSGEITAATGLTDAEAYAELARLMVAPSAVTTSLNRPASSTRGGRLRGSADANILPE